MRKTGRDIEREEKDAPALVLLNVNMLVGTNAPKDSVINANYHVAEGDRDKPRRRRQEQSNLMKPTTSYFNSAFNKTDCCPCE